MKKFIKMLCIALGGFSASLVSAQTVLPSLTFDEVRAKLLDQPVLVYDGENYGSGPRNVLTSMGNWMVAKQTAEGGYKLLPGPASSPIVGKTAKIVSVERAAGQGDDASGKLDVHGKAVAPSNNFDPEVTVIARLENRMN